MDKPVTVKESEDDELHDGLLFSASCMQGWRVNMEVISDHINVLF
jgi:hypothetical protein